MRTPLIFKLLMLGAVLCCVSPSLVDAQGLRPADHVLDAGGFPGASGDCDPGPLPPSVTTNDTLGFSPQGYARVELLSLDRTTYETGDDVAYEVLIENTGTTAIPLAWSPDLCRVMMNADHAEVTVGRVSLEVRDQRGNRLARLDTPTLFGAPSIPGTLEMLRPGQTARIKAAGTWMANAKQLSDVLLQPGGEVAVVAVFEVFGKDIVVASDNNVPVAIRQPRMRNGERSLRLPDGRMNPNP